MESCRFAHDIRPRERYKKASICKTLSIALASRRIHLCGVSSRLRWTDDGDLGPLSVQDDWTTTVYRRLAAARPFLFLYAIIDTRIVCFAARSSPSTVFFYSFFFLFVYRRCSCPPTNYAFCGCRRAFKMPTRIRPSNYLYIVLSVSYN